VRRLAPHSTDRPSAHSDVVKVRAFAVISVIMLSATIATRLLAPSPFAPRVHVRWAAGIAAAERESLERRFALSAGTPRDEATWEYDLTDVSRPAVEALIRHPAVADTHYLDREMARVAADAPSGSIPLAERRVAGWIQSGLFEWFMFFWAAGLIASGAWLAAPPRRT
jgi:hypothetical protein